MLHVSLREKLQRKVVFDLKKMLSYLFEIQIQSTLLPFQGSKKSFGMPKLQDQVLAKKYELLAKDESQEEQAVTLLFNSYQVSKHLPRSMKA